MRRWAEALVTVRALARRWQKQKIAFWISRPENFLEKHACSAPVWFRDVSCGQRGNPLSEPSHSGSRSPPAISHPSESADGVWRAPQSQAYDDVLWGDLQGQSIVKALRCFSPSVAGYGAVIGARRINSGWTAFHGGYKTLTSSAVPFRLDREEASEKFISEIGGHWLGPLEPIPVLQVREVFLPFWIFEATVRVLFTGTVGYTRRTPVYNSGTRRWEYLSQTEWRRLPRWHESRAVHRRTDANMQAYGSFRYRRSLVDALRGEHVSSVRPLDQRMLAGGREMDAFTMRREVAWGRVKARLEDAARVEALRFLRLEYRADNVTDLQLTVDFEYIHSQAVRLPAYVFEFEHKANVFQAIVSGVTGDVEGDRQYSTLKAALLTGTSITLLSLGLHLANVAHFVGSFGWTIGVGFLSAIAAAAADYIPVFLLWLGEARRLAEAVNESSQVDEETVIKDTQSAQSRQQRTGRSRTGMPGGAGFEQAWERFAREFEREFGRWGGQSGGQSQRWEWRWEDMRQQQGGQTDGARFEQQQRQQQTGQSRRQPQADPLGYYSELGLKPSSSQEEVKAAFRRLALEWHPDRHSDPNKHHQAQEKFKRISNAYQVLKDPERRTKYDQGWPS